MVGLEPTSTCPELQPELTTRRGGQMRNASRVRDFISRRGKADGYR